MQQCNCIAALNRCSIYFEAALVSKAMSLHHDKRRNKSVSIKGDSLARCVSNRSLTCGGDDHPACSCNTLLPGC